MAEDMGVPFLGRLPLDAALSRAGEDGLPLLGGLGGEAPSQMFANAPSAAPLRAVIDKLLAAVQGDGGQGGGEFVMGA